MAAVYETRKFSTEEIRKDEERWKDGKTDTFCLESFQAF